MTYNDRNIILGWIVGFVLGVCLSVIIFAVLVFL